MIKILIVYSTIITILFFLCAFQNRRYVRKWHILKLNVLIALGEIRKLEYDSEHEILLDSEYLLESLVKIKNKLKNKGVNNEM